MSNGLTLDAALGSMARGELPWGSAWGVEFQNFADCFTLHDSVWVGVFLDVRESNEAILIVEWDAYWLPESIRSECRQGLSDDRSPFLFIRLSEIHSVKLEGYEQSLSGRVISHAEVSDEDGNKVLEVVDIVGGAVRLSFGGRAEFLALRPQDGFALHLAKAERRLRPSISDEPWWKFW